MALLFRPWFFWASLTNTPFSLVVEWTDGQTVSDVLSLTLWTAAATDWILPTELHNFLVCLWTQMSKVQLYIDFFFFSFGWCLNLLLTFIFLLFFPTQGLNEEKKKWNMTSIIFCMMFFWLILQTVTQIFEKYCFQLNLNISLFKAVLLKYRGGPPWGSRWGKGLPVEYGTLYMSVPLL